MQNKNFCQIPGHGMNQITKICTFQQCQCAQRWVCEECQRQQIHQHENRSISYLISLSQFSDYLNNQRLPEMQVLQRQLATLKKLKTEMELTFKKIYNLIQFTNIYQQYKQSAENISLLSDQQLNSLLNIVRDQRSYSQINSNVQSMMIQLQNLSQKEIQFEMIHHQEAQIRDMSYPTISQNEKYLGFAQSYVCQRQNFSIRSLQANRFLYKGKTKRSTNFIKFSNNSKSILIVDDLNNINQYSIKSNPKLLFRISTLEINQLDQEYYDIIWIDSNQILINTTDLVLFDVYKKRELLRIVKQDDRNQVSIEYDRLNNFIITSEKSRINFYERNSGNSIINQETYKKDIKNIQLINESQNLITSHINSLRVWIIDHQKKRLTNIRFFNFEVFYSKAVYSDELFFIIRNKIKLMIIDYGFRKIYELDIQGSDFNQDGKMQQFMSLNYIIIQDQNSQSMILKNTNIGI